MKKQITTLRLVLNRFAFQEFLLIFFFVLLINNYFQNDDVRIRADGKGYYDYLPALFIYHDLNFQFTDTLVTELYIHRESSIGYLPEVNGKRINKYFAGTAIAQAPFFLTAHAIASADDSIKADGYSAIYQRFIFYAALFYTFLGLLFLRKILSLTGIGGLYIFVLQATVLFAGSLMYYVNSLPAFSHAYSFGLFNLFLYLVLLFFKKPKKRFLLGAAFCLGLIVLIRPVNVLVVAFVPFLFESLSDFKEKITNVLLRQWKTFVFALFIAASVVFIQPLIWFLQTGHFFIYSYQNEGFIFTNPNIFKFLFSFEKGLFVYAPAFFLLLLAGCVHLLLERNYWKVITFFSAFALTSWVLSSWWVWYYGGSIGSRVMIDYYGPMAIFGSSFFRVRSKVLKISLSLLLPLFMYVAIIQTFQYKNYILMGVSMTKEKYFKIFLKTDEKYFGVLYHNFIEFSPNQVIHNKITDKDVLSNQEPNGLFLIEKTHFESPYNPENRYILQIIYDTKYLEGTDQFAIQLLNSEDKFIFAAARHLFYGTLTEPFDGTALMNIELGKLALENATMRILLKKNEPTSTLRKIETKLIVRK